MEAPSRGRLAVAFLADRRPCRGGQRHGRLRVRRRREPACLVANRHFRELTVGREIETSEDIRALWDRIYALSLPYGRTGLPVMALSGLDLALWDLLGKVQGRPVYDLLGGLRKPKVRAYATGEAFERYRDLGYTAAKFSPAGSASEADIQQTAALARQARSLLGGWFEDVMTPDHLEEQAALREIVRRSGSPGASTSSPGSDSSGSPGRARSTSGNPTSPGAGESPRRCGSSMSPPSTACPSRRIAAARSGACT